MVDSVWGQANFISIFLEDISSIEVKYRSSIILLILCGLSAVGSLILKNPSGFIICAVFFAAYWFTRKHVISISSKGGSSLFFQIQEMDDKKIQDFIHEVSLAKQARVNQLHKL
jgi:citrate lyase synthetase